MSETVYTLRATYVDDDGDGVDIRMEGDLHISVEESAVIICKENLDQFVEAVVTVAEARNGLS